MSPGKYRRSNKIYCSDKCAKRYYRITVHGWAGTRLNTIKGSAKRRGLIFDLSKEDLIELGQPAYCKYLNIKLDYSSSKISMNSPSVNRIDPNKGYVKGNVEIISQKANIALSNFTNDELRYFIKNLIELKLKGVY